MTLTLEVTGSQAAKLGAARRKVFKDAGGTIGRLRENDWSLPDPYVSSRHALIRFDNGTFYLEDTSTNGVFVNGDKPENRLVKGQRYALKEGDWIFIEPYEIRAGIEAGVSAASGYQGLDDLFAVPAGPGPGTPLSPAPPVLPIPDDEDWFNKLGPDPTPANRPGRSAQELHGGSVQNEHFRPPNVVQPPPPPAAGGLIPDDYDPLFDSGAFARSPAPLTPSESRRVPRPEPTARRDHDEPRPSSRASGQSSRSSERSDDAAPARPHPGRGSRPTAGPEPRPASDVLSEVLRGAGIDPSAVTPEFAQDFGKILRLVVGGVMDVLQARQRIKSEFRMDMTTFRPADNNPLKFSANVDDALHNLLVKRNKAYLQPVDAFDDAFEDIRNHQMAMLAGMRVAFEAMLAQFDPARLQAEFDRQTKRGSLISVPAKLRYWDLYGAKFHDMVKDADAAFRELFGDEFAAAYEEQLKRLKSRSRDNEQ
jgi:type VI secretion system FHA domain protein